MILRPTTFTDEKLLLDWRNDPTVLAVSANTLAVSAESHKAWLFNVMRDTETQLYIAEIDDGIPIGQGRIERAWKAISRKMDCCLIGYSIAYEYRGQGHGAELVHALVHCARLLGYHAVSCRIKRTNTRSIAVAVKAGIDTIQFF